MIVYTITHKETGKVYVGITTRTLENRWRRHLYNTFSLNQKTHLYNAIRKYGEVAFELSIIQICSTQQELYDSEVFWISELNSSNPENGFNMTLGGDGGRITAEARLKISLANRGRKQTEEDRHKKSMALTGKIVSKETRLKISNSWKTRTVSDETKSKMSVAQTIKWIRKRLAKTGYEYATAADVKPDIIIDAACRSLWT